MGQLLGFFIFVLVCFWPTFEITAPWRKARL